MSSVPKNTAKNPVVMVATFNGGVVNFPAYLIDSDEVESFKAQFDGTAPGLVWFPMTEVMDMRGIKPFYSKLPRT